MSFGGGGYQSYGGGYGDGGYGGASYGGGGGGGYMPTTPNRGMDTTGGIGQSPATDGKKKGFRNDSIRPITSAQLQQAEQTTGDDAFKIDGEEFKQIRVVGEIVEVVESATNIAYKIDDRTGPLIEVRRWISDDSQTELQRRAACREGVYVKVTGQIRVLNKQLSMLGFRIKPIEDFNEVTNHLLHVILTHLALTKGMPLPKQFAELQSAQGQVPGPSGINWTAPMATSTQMSGAVGGAFGGMNTGLNPVQNQVLSVIRQCKSESGMHMRDIISLSKNGGFAEKNVRVAIEFLSNEGHIYSTVDDEHFRSTDDY